MSYRLRFTLAVFGLIVLAMALLALAYTVWPLEELSEQVPLAPTLFIAP